MKPLVIFSIVITLLVVSGLILFNQSKPQSPQNIVQTPSPSPVTQDQKVNIQANFTIITGNITRSFQAEKYHNQSPDVFIESSDPTVIQVKKSGITWDDFFRTLPMKLTKDCLITGDGETFCDGKDGSLKFYLNDNEDKDFLDKEIKQNDKTLIRFTIL